ncbi:MAG: hypothetical protein ABI042_04515 [Verrucomicrobiota bacterium]
MIKSLTVQPLRKKTRRKHLSESVLAGLLIALLAMVSLFSASPVFHLWLHHDAAQADHQCAITLLEKHHVLSSDTSLQLVFSDDGLILAAFPAQIPALPSVDYCSSPSRAPPVSFLL